MATIRQLDVADGTSARPQGEISAIIRLIGIDGEKFIQIDTYGSKDRQEVGKQSQSIRLSETAFNQLAQLGSKYF